MHSRSLLYVQGAASMHYCKLLSPARAMEWVHVCGWTEGKLLCQQFNGMSNILLKGTTTYKSLMYIIMYTACSIILLSLFCMLYSNKIVDILVLVSNVIIHTCTMRRLGAIFAFK